MQRLPFNASIDQHQLKQAAAVQDIAAGDLPPADTSILALTLATLEGLSEDEVLSLARSAAQSGWVLIHILAEEHLRRRMLRQSRALWRSYAIGVRCCVTGRMAVAVG